MKLIEEKKVKRSTVAITLLGLMAIGLLLSAPSSIARAGHTARIASAHTLPR